MRCSEKEILNFLIFFCEYLFGIHLLHYIYYIFYIMYNLSISEYLEIMLHPQISKKYIKNMKTDIIQSPNKKLMK